MSGILYGVGVGPGDPELITVKALRILGKSDLVILPAGNKEKCYAFQIVKRVYPEICNKEIVCLEFPMIKNEEELRKRHDAIYEEICSFLDKNKVAAFLTIGDPTIYSTYMYMHKRMKESGKGAEIISGVPSFCAAAAALNIALGENKEEIHIIPGNYDNKSALQYQGNKVFMKSGKQLGALINELKKSQYNNNISVLGISNCGMENESVYDNIDEIGKEDSYFTIVIVKEKQND